MSLNRDCTVHISGLKEQRNIVIQVDLSDFHDLIISKTKYQIEFVFQLKIVKNRQHNMEDKVCLEKVTQNNNQVCHPMHYCTSLKLGRTTA